MKDQGGPAYPSPEFMVPKGLDQKDVMTLRAVQGSTMRQQYKLAAMQALLSNSWWMERAYETVSRKGFGKGGVMGMVRHKAAAYADEMVAEDREAQGAPPGSEQTTDHQRDSGGG